MIGSKTRKGPRALAALIIVGTILGSTSGLAEATNWTNVTTTKVNYRQTQEKVRDELLDEINRVRGLPQKCGTRSYYDAPPLNLNRALSNAAYLHSKDMATKNYFSHISADGREFDERIEQAGYDHWMAGENIAAGQVNAEAVVAGWMASTEHCKIIMDPNFEDIGIGVYYRKNANYGSYWTTDFGAGVGKVIDDVVPFAVTPDTPTIKGTPKVTKTLTAKPGKWAPKGLSLSYQWLRDGEEISGATDMTYTLVGADRGKQISVKVTGSTGAHKASKTSAKTEKVAYARFKSGKPTISGRSSSGTSKVGQKLTAKPGTWTPGGIKFSYQWYIADKKIKNATKSTYVVKKSDKGKRIKVEVTGKKSGYLTWVRYSVSTKIK